MWKDIPGWFELIQGDILQLFCKDKIYLEVGSYKGRSTACAAEVAKEVHAVDTFRAKNNGQDQSDQLTTLDEFLSNTAEYKNITHYIGESKDTSKKFEDNSIDIIFIDGMHDNKSVVTDKECWWPKLKVDGYMIFHDYSPSCQVKSAVDNMFLKDEVMIKSCLAWVKKESRCQKSE